MIKELVRMNRSYRRFYENERVSRETLIDLVDTARLTGSAANRQPLRYLLVNEPEKCAEVFATLGWAGYLKDWDGPETGERPAAYILMIAPENVNCAQDEGIVAQTILLAAVEEGLGGCMLGNVNRAVLKEKLSLAEGLTVKLVLAIGKPRENIVIDDIHAGEDIKYYREPDMTHHVPKIILDDLLL